MKVNVTMDITTDGLLVRTTQLFERSEANLNQKEKKILDQLAIEGESSNPYVLAQYQAVISELHLMHTARSSILSVLKDTSKEIVGHFR
jgi:hypothetical protein